MNKDEQTPTQKASSELAEAVFADPALRARFEMMAKESANREPVPDDFAWLPQFSADDRLKIEAAPEDALRALLRSRKPAR